MKKLFALISSAALMLVLNFSFFNAPAFALPQDLVNWCVTANNCDVAALKSEPAELTAEVMVHGDADPKAQAECKRVDTVPPWADQNVEIKDDWAQYFTTDDGLIDYKCTLVH